MDIYFNGVEYKPSEKEVEEITFLGTKTIQAKVKNNLTIFWNPLTWDWTKVADKEAYETKYKRKTRAVYFKDKVFLVETSKFKKGIVDDEFVDTAELPIGIVVYWEADTEQWQMLGYKENLLR
jgi:guanylate kinase